MPKPIDLTGLFDEHKTTPVGVSSTKPNPYIESSDYGNPVVTRFNKLTDNLHKDYSDVPNYKEYLFNEETGIDTSLSEKDLQRIKAERQSNLEKAAYSVGQLVGSEVILGTIKAFSDIFDAGINGAKSIYDWATDNPNPTPNDFTNLISESLEQVQNYLREKMKIESANPEMAWNPGEFSWWANNFVSVGSSLTLAIPGKTFGVVGKLAKLTKPGKAISKAISPVSGTLNAISKGANRINRAANEGSKLAKGIQKVVSDGKAIKFSNNYYSKAIGDRMEDLGYAMLSRTAENYQEARQTYKEAYEYSLNHIKNMSAEQKQVFLNNNPEFKDKSDAKIAELISTKSANETFVNDYAMLLFDYMQFRSVGNILKRAKTNPVSNYTRLSAQQATAKMAGREIEKELVNTGVKGKFNIFGNWLKGAKLDKTGAAKDVLRYIKYNEGIEEAFQGIQQEKGLEVARFLLDPTYDKRDLSSYINDGAIWTQAVWGMLGGKIFEFGYNKFDSYIHKDAVRSIEQMRDANINGWKEKFDNYVKDIKLAEEGKNPYEFELNEDGTQKLDDANVPINKDLKDDQEILTAKKKATDKFISELAMNAVDSGIEDLLVDALNSEDIEKYFENQGLSNKEITSSLKEKLIQTKDLYAESLYNWFTNADIVDENILKAVARREVRTRLNIDNNTDEINDLYKALNDDEHYDRSQLDDYINSVNLAQVNISLNELKKEYATKEKAFNDKKISKAAFDAYKKEYAKRFNSIIDYARSNNKTLQIAEITNLFEEAQKNPIKEFTYEDINKFYEDFDKTYTDYFNVEKTIKRPTRNIQDKVVRIAQLELENLYYKDTLPNSEQEYIDEGNRMKDIFNNFKDTKMSRYIELVKDYLKNSKNVDEAFDNLLTGENLNKKLLEATDALKYGHVKYDNYTRIIKAYYENTKKDREEQHKKENTGITGDETFDNDKGKNIEENKELIEEGNDDKVNLPVEGNNDNETPTNVITDIEGITPIAEQDNEGETSIPTGKVEGTTPTRTSDEEDNTIISQDVIDDLFKQQEVSPVELEAVKAAAELEAAQNSFLNRQYGQNLLNSVRAARLQIAEDLNKKLNENPEYRKQFTSDKLVEYGEDNGNIIEITESEKTKREFIKNNKVTLKELGISDKDIDDILNNIYNDVIDQLSGKFKGFKKLIKNAIIGSSIETKESTTKFLDLNEVCDDLLLGYINKYNIPTRKDKKTIIDLKQLFDDLLNDKDNLINGEEFFRLYDNLGVYANMTEKYLFTGVNLNKSYGFQNLLSKLKFKGQEITISNSYMHIGIPNNIDKEQYAKTIAELYNQKKKAKVRIAKNGLIEVYSDIIGNDVVLGILKQVHGNNKFTKFVPMTNKGGFANEISKDNNGEYHLEIDDMMYALIEHNENNKDAFDLYDTLYDYAISLYNKSHANFVNDKIANKVLNNKYIIDLLNNKGFVFPRDLNDKEKTNYLLNKITTILFFKESFEDVKNTKQDLINNTSINPANLLDEYNKWKERVYENYKATYNIQQLLNNNTDAEFDVIGNIIENQITEEKDGKIISRNISELGFNTDPTSIQNGQVYNPLVVIRGRDIFGETINGVPGEHYGIAPENVVPGSMGFLIKGNDGKNHIALLETQNNIAETSLGKAVATEIKQLILAHSKSKSDRNSNRFDVISNKLQELFSVDGLFSFRGSDEKGAYIYQFSKNNDGTYCGINKYYPETRTKERVFTIMKYSKETGSGEKVISSGIYLPGYDKGIVTYNSKVIETIDKMVNDITSGTYIKQSSTAFDKINKNGTRLNYHDSSKEGFSISFGYGEDRETFNFKSLGDLIIQTGAYNTKQSFKDEPNGRKYVQMTIGEPGIYLNINDNYTLSQPTTSINKNSPLNLLYEKDNKRKTINSRDLLLSANFPQSYIDTIEQLNKVIGKQLILQNVYIPTNEMLKQHPTADAFHSNGKVYITPIGAMRMINNPKNAFRLLLHENIHRIFEQDKELDKQRLIEDLKEIFDYTMTKLDPIIDKNIIDVFKTATDNATLQENMEEFLVECMTQRQIMDRLNNIAWKNEVDVSNAEIKNKSIFNKIIDWLLKFFGINDRIIKKNSIFAREYEVLLKNINKSDRSLVNTGNINATNTIIDNISSEFSELIKRDENFEENHIYYIWNGSEFVKAGTSVTTLIHNGETQDYGKYGPVSTRLGTTVDNIARDYFAGELKTEYPNISQIGLNNLIKRLDNLKKYFDKQYGKGKYKCITNEFPIGAKYIAEDGSVKYVAGTMDMVIVDDKGNIHIYDFKTKRRSNNNKNAIIDNNAKESYGKQVNLYKEILEVNYPNLKGKIIDLHLIKFTTEYEDPNTIDYITSPVKGDNQLFVEENGVKVKVQDSSIIDYLDPTLERKLTDEVIIPREIKSSGITLQALDKIQQNDNTDDNINETITDDLDSALNIDNDNDIDIDEFNDWDEESSANNLEDINIENMNDIIIDSMFNTNNHNIFGGVKISDMNSLDGIVNERDIANFSSQIDENEVLYACKVI